MQIRFTRPPGCHCEARYCALWQSTVSKITFQEGFTLFERSTLAFQKGLILLKCQCNGLLRPGGSRRPPRKDGQRGGYREATLLIQSLMLRRG